MKTLLIVIFILIASIAGAEVSISYDLADTFLYLSYYSDSTDYSYQYLAVFSGPVTATYWRDDWGGYVSYEWDVMTEYSFKF